MLLRFVVIPMVGLALVVNAGCGSGKPTAQKDQPAAAPDDPFHAGVSPSVRYARTLGIPAHQTAAEQPPLRRVRRHDGGRCTYAVAIDIA